MTTPFERDFTTPHPVFGHLVCAGDAVLKEYQRFQDKLIETRDLAKMTMDGGYTLILDGLIEMMRRQIDARKDDLYQQKGRESSDKGTANG